MGDFGLIERASDGEINEFSMPLAPRPALINLRNEIALSVITIGIDGGKSSNAARARPRARRAAIGDRDALAPLNQRQNFCTLINEAPPTLA